MKNAIKETRTASNIEHENRDPITGEPGSHPVATTIGTVVGISAGVATAVATGATAGAALGPVGAAIGAVAGGIFGAGVGHAIGEDLHPTQIAWWKENYINRPYVKSTHGFESYEPAYWYGINAYQQFGGQEFDALEPNLRNNWNLDRAGSTLEWDEAAPAARDAYDRLHQLSIEKNKQK